MTINAHQNTRVRLLLENRAVPKYIHNYIAWIEQNNRDKARRLHTDSAKEVIAMRKQLYRMGINHKTSLMHSFGGNRVAGCTIRTVIDEVR